eukprot:Rhum_TRINITY_DN15768_c0_g1::Rhum_TRINITY_DN15768_c0_g1_i1::g.162049::m.162049
MPAGAGPMGGSPRGGGEEPTRNTKKMTQEALDKSCKRLAVAPPRLQETEPLVKPVKLNKSELDKSAERLCNGAVEHKRVVLQNLEAKTLTPQDRQVLDSETMINSVQRVYTQAMQHKKDVAERIRTKHMQEPSQFKKLSKTDQAQSNERNYSGPVQKKKEKDLALEEKYIVAKTQQYKVSYRPWAHVTHVLSHACPTHPSRPHAHRR